MPENKEKLQFGLAKIYSYLQLSEVMASFNLWVAEPSRSG
jgi:hypothetical protein